MLTHTILGSWEDFQQEAIARGDIEVHVCLLSDHFNSSIIKHAVHLLVPIKISRPYAPKGATRHDDELHVKYHLILNKQYRLN